MNMNLQGYSGLMTVTGAEGDPPTAISNSWNDYVGGLHACFAILQAIDKRAETGRGGVFDLSQFECSAAMIGPLILSSAVNESVPVRRGNRSDKVAPQGVYRCHGPDDWCALTVENDQQWNSLIRIIDQEKWASDERFSSAAGRVDHHDEIDRGIEVWTGRFSSAEVEKRLKAAEIPAERVRRINDVIDGSRKDTVFSSMAERRVGSMLTTTLPFTLSSVALPVARSAPSLGEHNTEVLREWLNISDEEILAIKSEEALK